VRPDHPVLKANCGFVVFYMPTPMIEPHACVEEKQDYDGDKTKPIKVVPTLVVGG
jgi:hypothetical protein